MELYKLTLKCIWTKDLFQTLFLLFTLLPMSLFSPFVHLHTAFTILPFGHHHTLVCVYWSCIYVLWLISSPSFIQPFSIPPLWQLSVCSMYPWLCFYFVQNISHISEIIWYLSFSDWFVSLNIIISSSIHAVTKGEFLIFYSCIVFHCINVPQLFYPLIYWLALELFPDLDYCN